MEKGGEKAVVILVFSIILLQIAWSDLKRRSVSNRCLLAGTVFGICFRGMEFLLPAGIILTIAFCGFCFRLMGAGDGKLMALIAGYLGLYDGIRAICAGIMIGGIWAVCCLWRTKDTRARLNHLFACFRRVSLNKPSNAERQDTVPLATCLAIGTGLYLFGLQMAEAGKGFL